MEPVSLVIASAAAGGVAGKLSERIYEHVCAFFQDGHAESTRMKAQENANRFADALLQRMCETLGTALLAQESQIEARLTDPEFAASLESATRVASRTSDGERHTILARLVTERLASHPSSVESVAAATAIDVLPRLAPLHVEMLGLLTALTSLRPEWWGDYEAVGVDEQVQWMVDLAELFDLDMVYEYQDVLHLASVGCVQVSERYPSSPWNLLTIGPDCTLATGFEASSAGKRLAPCWDRGLDLATPLPVGVQIGYAVYEQRFGRGDED